MATRPGKVTKAHHGNNNKNEYSKQLDLWLE